MPRYGLEQDSQRFATTGAIARNRIVKLANDRTLAYAEAAAVNAIGVTLGDCDVAVPNHNGVLVRFRNHGCAEIEVAAGESIDAGAEVFQAADGTIAATGTVRAGIAQQAGAGGDAIEVLHGA